MNRQQIANSGQMVQVNDLIRQLNRQQSNSNGGPVELSPNNAEALNGPTGAGIGLPFGTLNARIDKNPLIGANGLSKSALNDIMFGNFKGLAVPEGNNIASYTSEQQEQPESVQGGEMRQMVGGQENALQLLNGNRMNGNGMGNNMMSNLATLAAANNLAGTQGLNGFNVNPNNGLSMTTGTMSSLGLNGPNLIPPPGMNTFPGAPIQGPNPALGMQFMSQLSNMNANDDSEAEDVPRRHHHKRHHRHHKRRKSTTKLLLRLLVDKMKDIYELDKMTSPSKSKKTKAQSALGKIGLTLDDLGVNVPKDDVHKGDQNNTRNKFKTDLSFPVTVTDETESQHLNLISDDDPNNSKDDADIQKILSKFNIGNDGSGAGEPSKKSDDLKISELTDSVSKDIAAATRIAESGSKRTMPGIKGQKVKNEKAKARDSIRKFEDGSFSEFHEVKIDNDVLSKSGVKTDLTADGKSSLSETPNILDFNGLDGYDNAKVSAPKIFSVSSILNSGKKGKDDGEDMPTIHTKLAKSLLDYIPANKRKTFPEVKILPMVPSDINKEEDTLKSLTEAISHEVTSKVEDGANYVKSARVLGSVFKKVKDPVAKKSIATAIKAMLEVMKYKAKDDKDSSSKKYNFPADANTTLVQQIQNLNGVLQQMKKHLHHKRNDIGHPITKA